jgi:hypothetical protein
MAATNSGIAGIDAYVAGQVQRVTGAGVARATAPANPITWAGGTTNSTMLAASMIPGALVQRTGATGAFTETFDTAANIIAAYPEIEIGQTYMFKYCNVAAQTATYTTNTGITLTGLATNAGTSLTHAIYVTKLSATTLGILVTNC